MNTSPNTTAVKLYKAGVSAKSVIIPADNAREVACIEGMRILPASTLAQVIRHIEGTEEIVPQQQLSASVCE